jgi:hypothetical protein
LTKFLLLLPQKSLRNFCFTSVYLTNFSFFSVKN